LSEWESKLYTLDYQLLDLTEAYDQAGKFNYDTLAGEENERDRKFIAAFYTNYAEFIKFISDSRKQLSAIAAEIDAITVLLKSGTFRKRPNS
jgi:hypothetical protein